MSDGLRVAFCRVETRLKSYTDHLVTEGSGSKMTGRVVGCDGTIRGGEESKERYTT